MNQLLAGRLLSVFQGKPEPIVLLGAGASYRSGIPLAGAIVSKAAKWGYCITNGFSPDDPRVMRSDWLPWLKRQPWYRDDLTETENYPVVVENILRPAQNRKDFFHRLLNPGIPPSGGYVGLANIMANGYLRTVLTTNFDRLLEQAVISNKRPHHISLVQTPSDYINVSTNASDPQLIYLHGSVEHYTDRNVMDEVATLDAELAERLIPILRDHPLVVIGYRGGEPSVMKSLISDNLEKLDRFKHGVFWCVMKGTSLDDLPDMVRSLAGEIRSNFQLIEIDGFDELITEGLFPLLHKVSAPREVRPVGSAAAATFDMRPSSDKILADLEIPLLQSRVQQYCRALDLEAPRSLSREDPISMEQFAGLHLITRTEENTYIPTNAGSLLFANTLLKPTVKVTIQGPVKWVAETFAIDEDDARVGGESNQDDITVVQELSGNLWRQLDQIDHLLALVNRAFRVKGAISEDVRPYPPLALKEVTVNALVHREYTDIESTEIQIGPDKITFLNPGGLVDSLSAQIPPEDLEKLVRNNGGGLKGYRNPVIADLFYSAGKMDKRGSGLSDVCEWMAENGGAVTFSPSNNNSQFSVSLFARPEIVDQITNIASPVKVSTSRFVANILECNSFPQYAWHTQTAHTKYKSIWENAPSGWLPPFVFHESRIFTFHKLDGSQNVFGDSILDQTWEPIGTDELIEDEGKRRLVSWLFNEYLCRHLEAIGLIVDKKKKRAYFSAHDEGERKIDYIGRIKKATRTVVKKRVNPDSGKLRYWEHQSFSFYTEVSPNGCIVYINPGYVFTWDGNRGLLASDRVNKLSTRRASRDYNNSVLNNLVFWSRVIAEGDTSRFMLQDGSVSGGSKDLGVSTPQIEFSAAYPSVEFNEIDSAHSRPEDSESDIEELEEELALLAEESRMRALEVGSDEE